MKLTAIPIIIWLAAHSLAMDGEDRDTETRHIHSLRAEIVPAENEMPTAVPVPIDFGVQPGYARLYLVTESGRKMMADVRTRRYANSKGGAPVGTKSTCFCYLMRFDT